MTETIKILATLTDDELKKALEQVKGSDRAKAKALEEIRSYKELRKTVKSWFIKGEEEE